MYYLEKRMEISAAHKLDLPYTSKCQNLHGHNYVCVVYCKSEKLTPFGMVVDFTHIKKSVHEVLDHHYLNDIMNCNPTAENMAKWIMDRVNEYKHNPNTCYKVTVQESEGNTAVYER